MALAALWGSIIVLLVDVAVPHLKLAEQAVVFIERI